MADRIAVMNDGRVEQLGTPDRDLSSGRLPASSPTSSATRTSSRRRSTGASADARRRVRVFPARDGAGAATLMVRPESIQLDRTGRIDRRERRPHVVPRQLRARRGARRRRRRLRSSSRCTRRRRFPRSATTSRSRGRRRTASCSRRRDDGRRRGAAARQAARPRDARSRPTAASCRRSSCSGCSSSSRSGSSSVTRSGRRSTTPSFTTGRSTTTTTSSASPTYVSTMWATLWVAALATAIAIGLAFPFAYWLSRYVPPRMRTPLLVLVIVPFWTSYLLRVYSWLTILGEKGVLNRFLQWTGLTNHPIGLFLYDRPAVILVLVYLYFPFARAHAVLVDRALRLGPVAGRDGSRRVAAAGDLPDPRAADPAGHRHGGHLRLHPDPRRVPDAADRRRHRRRDDRQPDRQLLPGGGVHARRRGLAA